MSKLGDLSDLKTAVPPDELKGGLGGDVLRPAGIRDTRLIERALREQWPIPDEFREPIVKRQVRIAIDPHSSPRESTSAARCLVSMQQQNTEAALKALDKLVPDQHQHTHQIDELRAVIDEARTDSDYVRLERERAIAAYPQSGSDGHNGHARTLGNGAAPAAD